MKKYILALLAIGVIACKKPENNRQILLNRIDSLEKKLADSYKPGFGEFMSGIQAHHSKLWFAGQEQNWKLADFEVHEIMEALDDIKKYETGRKESGMITMINPALDSINKSIQQKDPVLFRKSFLYLTNSCNSCHRAANFEFNVVRIPDASPFTNQDFRVPVITGKQNK
jgi:hypothetical protein